MARLAAEDQQLALALGLLREAVRRAPDDIDVIAQLAKLELAQLTKPTPDGPCVGSARQQCIDEVEAHAQALLRLDPGASAGPEIGGRLRLLLGDTAGAGDFLKRSCPRVEQPRKCQLLQLEAAALSRDGKESAAIARGLVSEACREMASCGQVLASIAEIFLRVDEKEQALTYYQQAAHEDPSDGRWLKVANLAASLGHHALASEAFSRVQRQRGRADAAIQRRVEEERLRALVPETASSATKHK
jgi:tetratricopeptide (TPR) repeat protein